MSANQHLGGCFRDGSPDARILPGKVERKKRKRKGDGDVITKEGRGGKERERNEAEGKEGVKNKEEVGEGRDGAPTVPEGIF